MTKSQLEDSRRAVVARVKNAMEKIEGFDAAALDDLCRHYGFSYSQGMCTHAEAGVPVDRLVRVAANHYPVLGELLSKRREEAATLKKLCGKNGGKLKSKIAAYTKVRTELRKCSESRRQLYETALNNARSALADADRALREVERSDRQLSKELSSILQSGPRTDVSLVKGKRGYRLSANISTTTSPDAIIRQQQYVWQTSAKEEKYEEGIDL